MNEWRVSFRNIFCISFIGGLGCAPDSFCIFKPPESDLGYFGHQSSSTHVTFERCMNSGVIGLHSVQFLPFYRFLICLLRSLLITLTTMYVTSLSWALIISLSFLFSGPSMIPMARKYIT